VLEEMAVHARIIAELREEIHEFARKLKSLREG